MFVMLLLAVEHNTILTLLSLYCLPRHGLTFALCVATLQELCVLCSAICKCNIWLDLA